MWSVVLVISRVDGGMLCEVDDMMEVEEVDAIRRTYPGSGLARR